MKYDAEKTTETTGHKVNVDQLTKCVLGQKTGADLVAHRDMMVRVGVDPSCPELVMAEAMIVERGL